MTSIPPPQAVLGALRLDMTTSVTNELVLYTVHMLDFFLVTHVPSRKEILDDLGIGSGDAVSAAFLCSRRLQCPCNTLQGDNIFFVDSCFLVGSMTDEAK
jgi:hypothetical protein